MYNTVILVCSVITFLDRNFLFIEKVQSFLDLKYNLKRQEPSRYREKLSPKSLYKTSCQNNSVMGNFMKRLCHRKIG